MAEKEGFASLEPPAKQSTGLFFHLSVNTQLLLLAPNSNPSYQTYHSKKKGLSKGSPYKGFFETLKIYRKLHFQAEKQSDSIMGSDFSFGNFIMVTDVVIFNVL